jgi:hypothetical protein
VQCIIRRWWAGLPAGSLASQPLQELASAEQEFLPLLLLFLNLLPLPLTSSSLQARCRSSW